MGFSFKTSTEVGSSVWNTLSNAADNTPWRKNAGLMKLNFFVSIIFFAQVLYGYDGTVVGSMQAMPSWQEDMGHPSSSRIGMLNAFTFISGILTGPLIAFIADKYGRKQCLRYYGVVMTIGTVVGVIAGVSGVNGFAAFCVSRVFCGSGLVANIMTGQILIQEIAHPRFRLLTASIFNVNWSIGAVTSAWVAFGCAWIPSRWGWRVPYLIQLIPSVYVLISVNFVPESPRWLLAQGRSEEALDFLVKYHGNGNPNDELVLHEFKEMQDALQIEKETEAASIKMMFATAANRSRMGLVALIGFMQSLNGSAVVYFYYWMVLQSVGITSAVAQTGINAGLYLFDFVMSFFGAWLATKVKRRTMTLTLWPLYAASLAVMAITGAVYANTMARSAAIGTVFGLWFIYLSLGTITTPIFFAYPAEILHYSMRTKGMSWNVFVAQAGGIFNTWVTPIIYERIAWKFYIIWIVVVLFQTALAYFFMVETFGYTLEEIAIAFEGKNSAVAKKINEDIESVSAPPKIPLQELALDSPTEEKKEAV